MNEAQFRMWERELHQWQRRLAQQPVPPALDEELRAALSELEVVRGQLRQPISGDRVARHLQRLRDLWQIVAGYDESFTTPA